MMVSTDLLLAYGASVKEMAKGDIIYREGEPALFYFQLLKGRVKWMHTDEEGREFIYDIIEAGEPFGEAPSFFFYDVVIAAASFQTGADKNTG
jgi:CRP-like cAMP-binding protein